MSATVERVDLDAIEVDAQEKIDRLREAVSRLSLDAFSDPAVREELIAVEHELSDVEVELQRIASARAEQERRDMAAREAAETERQQAAYNDARRLQVERSTAAKAVDRAGESHVAAVLRWVDVCRRQEAKLRESGRPAVADMAKPRGHVVEAAFAHAFRDAWWAGTLRGLGIWDRLPLIRQAHKRPLAESDAKPVEPEGD
jgi:hypothetical protein